jgi:hypothetical protein
LYFIIFSVNFLSMILKMSEQINSEILWWNPPIEEDISQNLLLPQYYLVSSPSSLVNEMPGVVTDYFIQSSTPFLGTIPEFDAPNSENDTSSPTLSDGNMTSNGMTDNQPGRRRARRRSLLDEATRVARRRERNRLAARRSRDRSRNYYNQLEQRVVELEAEVVRLRGLLELN